MTQNQATDQATDQASDQASDQVTDRAAASVSVPATDPAADQPSAHDPGPPSQPSAAPPQRRVLRAVLRWTAAVVVFAVAAGGTAYGLTQQKRSDLPGLATESDGRWDYPVLTRPALPKGAPRPFDQRNAAQAHYADPRALVLPEPEGARPDKGMRSDDGWVETKTFLAQYDAEEREELGTDLTDAGLRHITGRGWVMPDGTRTRIFLLHFGTGAQAASVADGMANGSIPQHYLTGALGAELDQEYPEEAHGADITVHAFDEPSPRGAAQVRQAYLVAGDMVALVTQQRKGSTPAVPFQQTVALQSELLG
ncbi:hypothetical protein OKJ48_07270 [Streptomyces kunmingensis]|uniref:Secreted protein n=1 Tax=Streptomyces kunmingensis TaxID=68225 RepID=A0ABU6C5R2_9ACTN|nr:hypothetical protein [Streptomyces kunmingensis]MEB3960052.1 hypothetical protein [Streptomyces kunmingensis]